MEAQGIRRRLVDFYNYNITHPYSSFEKSIIIERTIQYRKDRTEGCFDYYFPCNRKPKCKLKHVINWFSLFIYSHNKEIKVK